MISALLGALNVSSTMAYGKRCFRNFTGKELPNSISDLNISDRKILLWLILLGHAISKGISTIISLSIGVLSIDIGNETSPSGGFPPLAIIGAIFLGVMISIASILLRHGNVSSSQPAVNALFFLSPVMALIWLSRIGIIIPRTDLFIIGAALILTINILIQWNPDEERNLAKFHKDTVSGTRLGFTTFIMSIWVFGTFLYLRDEIMPSSRLVYSIDEYWGLIALSATVFALILGFRIARLSARINKEDETMLNLIRDSQYLVRKEILDQTIVKQLADLDSSKPKDLLGHYRVIRKHVKVGIDVAQDAKDKEDKDLLLSVEKQLDTITHSKQQGRDIVELLSLTAFAAVTIGLGLWARPKGLKLDLPQASWSGFLSEVFILLFVSTIAFLCINLFDIRRERETPLLVPVEEERDYDDYQLFFRSKQDLRVQHLIAVLISITMSITFCALLYNKWI